MITMDLKELELMVKDLVPLVQQDGRVTDDERNLVRDIKVNVTEFVTSYQEACRDGVISEQEQDLLGELWRNIYRKAEEEAKKDEQVSPEELRLLIRVFKTVMNS